jgi:hypothetical protein
MIEGAGAIDGGLGSKACLRQYTLAACVGKQRGCRVPSRVVCLSIFTLVALYYSRFPERDAHAMFVWIADAP